ncbi:uncharacterized protein SAPINGB_P001687 [Magnusiomyces paraingens]|uniref:Phospholipid:diacylglycerol acyltransferase n=1 Tax=Magnusiomyces paraingens TaxID=2606893 RepID=A0A5E8B6Y8_9ASCO|nr:uncharacterized protein SAPINGB_P001687 [Saprochaete ingens]VVT47390.1 unnamed protein product [Saprochaete ingens]
MPIVTSSSSSRKRADSSEKHHVGTTGASAGVTAASARQRKNSVNHGHRKSFSGSSSNSKSANKKSVTDDQDNEILEKANKPKKHHQSFFRKRLAYFWKTRKFVFILGACIGLIFAGYYTAQSQDLMSMDILNDLSMDTITDILSDFKGKLPMGILKEAHDLEKSHSSDLSEPFKIGLMLRDRDNITANYPVIMIPGVISTGLESWSLEGTPECPTKQYFRKRLWGSWHMLRAMLLDKNCWLQHLMLDPVTGLDPPNFKIRAAQGMEAADFFVAGYWIWNRILENLAAVGYDSGSMMVASYDWRLAYQDLETRDQYFSKLKLSIENYLLTTGKKTVLVGHSMGSQIVFYFLKWVEASGPTFGNGGSSWVDDHIESFIDISGSTLGTPKAIVALLSGEMKDTVQLNAMAVYGLEKFFSRRERADLLRNFAGIASMLPKGGQEVWGDQSFAHDDYSNQNVSFGNFIRFKQPKSNLSNRNLTIPDSIEYLRGQASENFSNKLDQSYSYGLARTRKELEANEADPRKWANPLEVALPNAPNMKIYCFYGVGKPTERSYYYKEEDNKTATMLNVTIAADDPNAVVFGEGDGTVSLVTHSMCHKWRDPGNKFNPAGIPVRIVEMAHEPDNFDIRGGAKTAEHVDILGRAELNELVVKVAAGQGSTIDERLISPLKTWVKNMDLGED